jgi:hypothetical protein
MRVKFSIPKDEVSFLSKIQLEIVSQLKETQTFQIKAIFLAIQGM